MDALELPLRCLTGVLDEPQRCLRGALEMRLGSAWEVPYTGASELTQNGQVPSEGPQRRLKGALEVTGAGGVSLEVPQQCFQRALDSLEMRPRGASEVSGNALEVL